MRKVITSTFIFGFFLLFSCEDKSTDGTPGKIDNLFRHWDNPNSPGAAIAVIKDGQIVFTKGYGMANLEYNIPITPSSIFHIASESKQYTAFCIVLLAQEGRLSLDDDIRKHLPYVPDFGKTITIRHLIYHTSGLRDQWQMLAIGGQAIDDVIKQEHVVKLVEKQRDLNFEPGTRSLYCNTGYTLLAEIVKKVSGKSLREYADEKIFKPLGMENTHFHDDNTEIVKGRTYSYDSTSKDKFANSPLNYAIIGATSLFTTVEDEAKWLNNYETGKVGGKDAVNQMYQQAILNNGKKLDYAFAIVIDSVNGYQRIGHGGADAGYRTYAVRFPEEKLGIVIFSNLGQFDPHGLATKVAELYLPKRESSKKTIAEIESDRSLYKFYKGSYCTPEGNLQIVDSTDLYVKFGPQSFVLTPLSDTSFSLFDGYAKLIFAKDEKPSGKFLFVTNDDEVVFIRSEKPVLKDADLTGYLGTYVSSELDAQYEIVKDSSKLILRHRKYPDVTLEAITVNQFSTPHWWMSNIIFKRNLKGEILGFEVNCDRVLHLVFQKQPTSKSDHH